MAMTFREKVSWAHEFLDFKLTAVMLRSSGTPVQTTFAFSWTVLLKGLSQVRCWIKAERLQWVKVLDAS